MFSASKTAAPVSGSFQVSNSLRLRASASAYLSKTLTLSATWTLSLWIKRGKLGVTSPIFGSSIAFNSNDTLTAGTLTTTAVYRDPSSWYHIVVSNSGCYVNGVSVGSVTTGILVNPSIGNYLTNYFDGYMAEVNFIDGQALTPSSFGSINATTGVWQPARYTGSYGTNGFYLKFNNGTSTTTLGNDSSGNNNNWTTNNISLTAGSTYDWMIDSPTSYAGSSYGVGNYAVLSPLITGNVIAPSSGNLDSSLSSGVNAYFCTVGTMAVASGKWYWECSITARDSGAGQWVQLGIVSRTTTYTNNALGFSGNMSNGYAYFNDGYKAGQGSTGAYAATFTTSDVIGVALDLGAGTLTFYKNGTSQGQAFSGITSAESWLPIIQIYRSSGTTNSAWINFGQRPFSYTPPAGYKSLCTQNLPAPAIYNGANHMAATTYTGNGSTQSISNAVNSVSFQPDFVWLKSRSNAYSHKLYDSIRGVYKELNSDSTAAESTDTNQLTAFNSNGWSVGSGLGSNGSGSTFVGWQWKAGGTAVTNTSGTITSSVSANTTAGFSVVTYTGTNVTSTVGHGLGVAPSMLILKRGNSTSNWGVYHSALSANGAVFLDLTDAYSSPGPWNNTAPTSSVFTIATGSSLNASGGTYVAYCFAAISGYSAFGSYTGNGSADGPFVYTGFRPRFILIKGSSFVSNWFIEDASRNGYNVNSGVALRPNLSNAEDGTTIYDLDILSNGFKLRSSSGDSNSSGATFIYACFAENPFQNSLAR